MRRLARADDAATPTRAEPAERSTSTSRPRRAIDRPRASPRRRARRTPIRIGTASRASRRSSGSSARARSGRRSASRSIGPAGRSSRSPAATRAGASGSERSSRARARSPRRRRSSTRSELVILTVPDDAIAALAASCGCTAARRSSTPAGVLGARCSSRRWPPARRSARFHPLVAFADTERAVAALHGATSPSRATTSSSRCSPTWPRRIGAHRRPARAGQQGRLPRRGGPRGRRLRRRCSTRSPSSARRRASTRPARWPIYGPLIEPDARQRRGARASAPRSPAR